MPSTDRSSHSPLPTILNTFVNFLFGRIPLKDNTWSHVFIFGHLLCKLVITINHIHCLKGNIPTTNQRVTNICFQKVLRPEWEKSGNKSGFQNRKSESGRIESGRKSGLKTIYRYHKLVFNRGVSTNECFNQATVTASSSQMLYKGEMILLFVECYKEE